MTRNICISRLINVIGADGSKAPIVKVQYESCLPVSETMMPWVWARPVLAKLTCPWSWFCSTTCSCHTYCFISCVYILVIMAGKVKLLTMHEGASEQLLSFVMILSKRKLSRCLFSNSSLIAKCLLTLQKPKQEELNNKFLTSATRVLVIVKVNTAVWKYPALYICNVWASTAFWGRLRPFIKCKDVGKKVHRLQSWEPVTISYQMV